MSPRHTRSSGRKLVLHRETIRNLQDQSTVRFGPQTSETDPCCTWEPDTQPVENTIRTY